MTTARVEKMELFSDVSFFSVSVFFLANTIVRFHSCSLIIWMVRRTHTCASISRMRKKREWTNDINECTARNISLVRWAREREREKKPYVLFFPTLDSFNQKKRMPQVIFRSVFKLIVYVKLKQDRDPITTAGVVSRDQTHFVRWHATKRRACVCELDDHSCSSMYTWASVREKDNI